MSPVGQMLNQLNYANKNRTKDDAKRALEVYRSLMPKISFHVNNLGVQSRLLALCGTIPIKYQGTQYNIPVEIFLPERYPLEAPKIYIRPTPTMTIKANHPHVDMQGVVYLPYLHSWTHNNSNIVGLIGMCSQVFSVEPPLFSKPSTTSAVITSTASVVSSTGSAYGVTAYGTTSAVPTTAAATSATVRASQTGGSSYVTGNIMSATTATPAVVSRTTPAVVVSDRAALIDRADLALQGELYAQHGALHNALATQFSLSRSLDEAERSAHQHLLALKDKVVRLENALKDTHARTNELRQWRERETAARNTSSEVQGNANEEVVERVLGACVRPGDALSPQMVSLQSESDAVDDALYLLERALLTENGLELNAFLREVRALSRRQFLCRAHLAKIAHTIQLRGQQGAA